MFLAQNAIGLTEEVQPFFRSNSGEITNAANSRAAGSARFETREIDPHGCNVHLARGNTQKIFHQGRIKVAVNNKRVDRRNAGPHEFERFETIGVIKTLKEIVLSLQSDADWPIQQFLNGSGQPDQERILEMHDLRCTLGS